MGCLFLIMTSLCVLGSVFCVFVCFLVVFVSLVIITGALALDCLERLNSQLTYHLLSETLNPAHSPPFPCL